ncbi:MAG: hypothetical protein E6R12_00425 [Sphingomonadales bacterium]|nr:MAG: hypothetical protein E6R12_00425 [Sphingomonadales bacterium]
MTEIDNRPSATPTGNFELNRPTIVGLLYAGSYLTGLSGLIGLVLAYVWKGEPHEPWEATHYTYLIRSFWIGLAAIIVGVFTMLIGIGFLLLGGAGIWFLVRLVLSLVNAQKRQPMPNPETYLF